jgi:hypothetical protein
VKFFLDNCTSPYHAKGIQGFAELQKHEIIHLRSKFEQDTKDTAWIAALAAEGDRVAGESRDEEAAHRHRPTFDGCAACAPRCPPIYLPVGCPPHPRILSMSDSEVERTELVVSRGAIFNAVVFQLMDYFRPSIGEGVTLFEYEAQAIAGDVVQQLLNHREMPDTRNVPATPSRDSCRPGAA